MSKILVCGNTTADIITVCNEPYNPSGKRSVAEYTVLPGGQAANAATLLANLGNNVSFIGAIGNDAMAQIVKDDFAANNIDISASAFCNAPHHLGFVRVDQMNDERLIDMYRHKDLSCKTLVPERLNISDYDCIYIDGHEPEISLKIGQLAKQSGIPVISDMEEITKHSAGLIDISSVLIAPEKIIQELAENDDLEKALRAIYAQNELDCIVATRGEEDCTGLDDSGLYNISGRAVEVIDTTGAGDAYHGAFTHYWVHNFSTLKCMDKANRIAAEKCRYIGARMPADIAQSFVNENNPNLPTVSM
ncbi:MAG: PfkB family carbohydrate kinase [Alphaproteobacteria bacterium]